MQRTVPFLLLSLLGAMLLGYLVAVLQGAGWAPVGLLSILVGGMLGGMLLGIAAFSYRSMASSLGTPFAGWKGLLLILLFALTTVVAEHGWLYHDYRQQWYEVRLEHPELAIFRADESPLSLGQYFAKEATTEQMVLWIVDGTLIGAIAVGVIFFRPFSGNPLDRS